MVSSVRAVSWRSTARYGDDVSFGRRCEQRNILGKAALRGAHDLEAWPGSGPAAGERLRWGTLRFSLLVSYMPLAQAGLKFGSSAIYTAREQLCVA